MFIKNGNAFERIVLGGWELSGVTFVQSGVPQPINYNGADTLGLGGGTSNRPNIVGRITYPKTQLPGLTRASFAAPIAPWNGGPNNGWGNAGKDQSSCRGSSTSTWPSSKLSHSQKQLKFQFRLETFNTFNHTEFNGIDSGFNDGNFGQVTSAYDPRVLQLGGKLTF